MPQQCVLLLSGPMTRVVISKGTSTSQVHHAHHLRTVLSPEGATPERSGGSRRRRRSARSGTSTIGARRNRGPEGRLSQVLAVREEPQLPRTGLPRKPPAL